MSETAPPPRLSAAPPVITPAAPTARLPASRCERELPERLSPWQSLWLSPALTMAWLRENAPGRATVTLTALPALFLALTHVTSARVVALAEALGGSLFVTLLLFLVPFFLVYALVVTLVYGGLAAAFWLGGRITGGRARAGDCYTCVAWGALPLLLATIAEVLLGGLTGGAPASGASLGGLAQTLAGVWTLILTAGGLAGAHALRVSATLLSIVLGLGLGLFAGLVALLPLLVMVSFSFMALGSAFAQISFWGFLYGLGA